MALILASMLTFGEVAAEDGHHGEAHIWQAHPQHLSLVLGGTDDGDRSAETLGVDYEYRLNHWLGVGAVVERAFGPLHADTFLAVADIHLWRGLIAQTGVGIEIIDEVEFEHGHAVHEEVEETVFRLGALYEFEFGRWTVSPQLHLDVTSEADSVVYVMAFGRSF